MIYPNTTVEEWCRKHPEIAKLLSETDDCQECERPIGFSVPFISKNFIGFSALPCECGNEKPGHVFIFRGLSHE